MASEPENHKMDELLKAYAKQRKGEEGDPFALHPATRKLLQDEVTRTYGKRESERDGWMARLFAFWPRIGFAATTLLALAIVIWVVLPNRESATRLVTPAPKASSTVADREQLEQAASDSLTLALQDESRAYKDTSLDKKEMGIARENLRRSPSGPASDGDNKRAMNEVRLRAEPPQIAQNLPAPAAVPPLAPAQPSEAKRLDVLAKNVERDKLSETTRESDVALRGTEGMVTNALGDRVASASKPGETPLSLTQKTDGAAAVAGEAAGTQLYYFQNANILPAARYVQVPAQRVAGFAGGTNISQPVLTSFEFEKTGDQVRITDADGSVYQGQVLSQQDTYLGVKVERETVKAQAGKTVEELQRPVDTPQSQQVLFRASGTNRSLRKVVNIEATFAPPDLQQQSSSAVARKEPAPLRQQQTRLSDQTSALGRQSFQFGVSTQQLMPNIRGRARIGTNQEVPIEAVPAQR
jgi:hypothetical protein